PAVLSTLATTLPGTMVPINETKSGIKRGAAALSSGACQWFRRTAPWLGRRRISPAEALDGQDGYAPRKPSYAPDYFLRHWLWLWVASAAVLAAEISRRKSWVSRQRPLLAQSVDFEMSAQRQLSEGEQTRCAHCELCRS